MALQNSTLSTLIPSSILNQYASPQYTSSATARISASIVTVTPEVLSERSTDANNPSSPYYNPQSGPFGSVANLSWTYLEAIQFDRRWLLLDAWDSPKDLGLWLTPTGCSLGGGLRNCTEACAQKELIFNDTSTLANCMALPFISQMLGTSVLSETSRTIATSYGILANNAFANEVESTLTTCFRAYCQRSQSCRDSNVTDGNYYPKDTLWYDSQKLCNLSPQTVLGDIAGIGIYTSYWLQSGIALAAWILLKIYDPWIYYLVVGTLVWFHGLAQARNAARLVHAKAKERALPRLAVALVEFQKAQCYFMIAVQIAALVTLSEGRLQSANLQQLYNNWATVRVISASGLLPVTFNLLCLQSAGKKSWYLIFLSTITVVISAATLFRTGDFSPNNHDIAYLQAQAQAGGVSECGNHDPTVYCLQRYLDERSGQFIAVLILEILNAFLPDPLTGIFSFSLTILVLLYVDMLKFRIVTFYQRHKTWLRRFRAWGIIISLAIRAESTVTHLFQWIYRHLQAKKTSRSPNILHWISRLRNFLAACVLKVMNDWQKMAGKFLWFVVWAWYLHSFLGYFEIIYFNLSQLVDDSWSFGQIVGITIWAEPLVEYAYLEIQGMKAANYRFLSPWSLTRTDGTNAADRQTMPEPSQYELKPISDSFSKLERSSSASPYGYSAAQEERFEDREAQGYAKPKRSPSASPIPYSAAHDEHFEDREEQQYMDTMAQRLL